MLQDALVVLDSGFVMGLLYSGVAIGLVFSFVALDFPDLTVEGSFPLGGAMAAVVLTHLGQGSLLSTVAAFLVGCLAGLLTCTVHLRLGLSKLVSGISVAFVLYTVCLLVMGNRANISLLGTDTVFSYLRIADGWLCALLLADQGTYLHPATLAFLALLVSGIGLVLVRFLGSAYGIGLRATGANESALRTLGYSTGTAKYTGLALANGLTAVAGALVVQYQGFADVTLGTGIIVTGLAGLVLGLDVVARLGISGRSVWGMFVGAVAGMVLLQLTVALAMRILPYPSLLRLLIGLLLIFLLATSKARKSVLRW